MRNGYRPIRARAFATVAVAMGLVACGTVRLQQTWVKPNLQIQPLRHVMTVALTPTTERRLVMEEALAEELRSEEVEATASYTTMPNDDIRVESQLRTHLDVGGYDGVIMLRVTDVTRQDVYVPGKTAAVPAHYQTLWDYYGHWSPVAYGSGYVEPDRNLQVETEVYALPSGDLVYSAVSGTLNPTSNSSLAAALGRSVASDLKSKGLILK